MLNARIAYNEEESNYVVMLSQISSIAINAGKTDARQQVQFTVYF